jgi:hypothetical protein
MDITANYISNYITSRVEEKHPYFDFDDEYDEFTSDEDIKNRLIQILKSNYSFSEVNEVDVEIYKPPANHICMIEIVHNEVAYHFTIEIYICSRGYKYLNVQI